MEMVKMVNTNTTKTNEKEIKVFNNKKESNAIIVKANTGYPNFEDYYEAEYEAYPYK